MTVLPFRWFKIRNGLRSVAALWLFVVDMSSQNGESGVIEEVLMMMEKSPNSEDKVRMDGGFNEGRNSCVGVFLIFYMYFLQQTP